MKKKTKEKILKGSLCVLTGFFLISLAYYERKLERSPMIIANLEENNNRVYQEVQKEDLLNILRNETGVVLFVSSMLDASKFIDILYDYKDKYTIYVYSLRNDKMELSLNEKKAIVVNKKQSKLYDELIDYLGAYADNQVFVDEDGSIIRTDYKVIYTPTVLFIKDGKPMYSYSFINEDISNEELIDIYKQGFDVLKNGYNS